MGGLATRLSSRRADVPGREEGVAADAEAGSLAGIHEKSERLAPSAQTLLERSTSLPADKRTRVASAVKQMPKLADALHAAADKGAAAATRRQLTKLDGLLQLMRAQYPPEAFVLAVGHPGHSPASAGASPHVHAHGGAPLAQTDAAPEATLRVEASEFDFQPRTLHLRAGQATRIEFAKRRLRRALARREGAGWDPRLDPPARGAEAARRGDLPPRPAGAVPASLHDPGPHRGRHGGARRGAALLRELSHGRVSRGPAPSGPPTCEARARGAAASPLRSRARTPPA